ncbi:MAG: hypothetical protein KGQ59_01500 [Bdellovibrionales bacterium]|nr:hypothetical protein [Bdellovibrionales bacterium]
MRQRIQKLKFTPAKRISWWTRVSGGVLVLGGLLGMIRSQDGVDYRSPASRLDLRPAWSTSPGPSKIAQSPNSSVLSRPKYSAPPDPDQIAAWLQPSDSGHVQLERQMKEEWTTRVNTLEMRERHNLLAPRDELELSDNNRRLGKMYLRSLVATHLRDSLREAEKNSEPIRVVSNAQRKLEYLAVQGMKVEVAPQTRLGSKADIVRQRGSVWMDSPWLKGAVDFQLGDVDSIVAANSSANSSTVSERYRLSLRRSLPGEIQTGMIYGGTSRIMTTSVSRSLLPHLSCALENHRKVSDSYAEQMARLNYQIRF